MISFKLIIVIFAVMGVKFGINLFKWLRLKKLKFDYKSYLDQKVSWKLYEKKQEIIELFKSAGLSEPLVPYEHPNRPTEMVGLFNNMMVIKPLVIYLVHSLFCQAIGVYKKRAIDSLNPIYWIELVLYFPQKIICYLGLAEGRENIGIVAKTLNMFYWIIGIILSILFLNPEVKANIIQKLIQLITWLK